MKANFEHVKNRWLVHGVAERLILQGHHPHHVLSADDKFIRMKARYEANRCVACGAEMNALRNNGLWFKIESHDVGWDSMNMGS